MMKRHNVGVIPVCEGKRLLGILTDRDLVISCIASDMDPRTCSAKQFMTSSAVTVTPDTDLDEAARLMGQHQVRRLPAVKDGDLVGIISIGDLSLALSEDKKVADMLRKISAPTHAVPA